MAAVATVATVAIVATVATVATLATMATMATLATVVSFLLASMKRKLGQTDVVIYLTVMGLLIVVGLIGTLLHIQINLTTSLEIVPERFLRGAPFLAPLLYVNMGIIGICALLSPTEGIPEENEAAAQPA